MASFAPYPQDGTRFRWEFEEHLEEFDMQPNHGLTTEFYPFPTLMKDNVVSEEPEWDAEEDFCEETMTKSRGESFIPFLSCGGKVVTELIEDHSENTLQEHRLKSLSDLSGDDHGCSHEKKRQLNVDAFEPSDHLQKNLIKPESDVGYAVRDFDSRIRALKSGGSGSESSPKQEEHAENSGKQRRTRWGPEQACEIGENDGTNKRRKTRWDTNDFQLKLLGPMHLPDFLRKFNESELDPERSGLKAKLMEINRKLQSSDLRDDRPEEERSPSPEPIYNNLGRRINTREVRLRRRLSDERSRIISKLVKKNPTFKTPPKPKLTKLSKKLYIPVKEYPTYNFIGLIIGPRGNTQKKMEKETGAKIYLRGKGAENSEKRGPTGNEDLHVRVEADNKKSFDAAVAMIEKLLIPVADGSNCHKGAQLVELSKLKGTYKDRKNTCNICKEQGHREYARPFQKSAFERITCNSCGSFCHLTSNCPLSISSQICEPSWKSSGLGSVSVPNTETKLHKEIGFTKLYVGYLPQIFDSKRLKELFLPFGKITDAKVIKDRITGLSKGYGFVTFENPADVAGAVEYMNGCEMDGKKLAVRFAKHPEVADYLPSSNLAILSGPMSALSSSQWKVTSLPVPAASMLPQSQSSMVNCGIPFSYQYPDEIPLASQFTGETKYLKSMFHKHFNKPTVEQTPAFHLDPMPGDMDSTVRSFDN
ncbi:hypothetical protein ACH5RR_019672 [Cinchona calisaya]|uniref:Branchpoint-bridging protein n=1 Tax=Cinchona calisaya TaxID=153742 RepID=A0ABD2ZVB0_9GENT